MLRWWTVPASLLLGCTQPEDVQPEVMPPFELSPLQGPSTGYFEVEVSAGTMALPDSVEDLEVRVAGIRAVEVSLDAGVLRFVVQGSPTPGPARLELVSTDETLVMDDALTYDPPFDPRFERVVAFGASLSQGVQDGVPTTNGILHSPPIQVARQLSAYFPVPLIPRGLVPSLELEDVGPPPDCTLPDATDLVADSALTIIKGLTSSGAFSFRNGRMDPDIEVHNLAVGGTDLDDIVNAPQDFGLTFLSHIVYDPSGPIADPVESQLDVVQQMQPTLIMSTDMYGNDLVGTMLGGDPIDPGDATPEEELFPLMDQMVTELASTGAEVFLANLPRPSLLPAADTKRAVAIAIALDEAETTGGDPEEAIDAANLEVDAALAEVDAVTSSANDELLRLASAYDNVHVVDLRTAVDELMAEGLPLGDTVVQGGQWGGLISLDGLHFTDTGYAMVANTILEAIDDTLGTTTGRVDLEAVHAADARSPAAVAAAGIDVSLCQP